MGLAGLGLELELGLGRQPSISSGTAARTSPEEEGFWRVMCREGREGGESSWERRLKEKSWRLSKVPNW